MKKAFLFSLGLLSIFGLATSGIIFENNVNVAYAEAPTSIPKSKKSIITDTTDYVDFYGAMGSCYDETYGDGTFTFAHAGLTVPLKGDEIRIENSIKLKSAKSVEDGGDGVDGWLTYSFSAEPCKPGPDNCIPNYAGMHVGYFFHVTNYSGTTAPNCVEIQAVKAYKNDKGSIRTQEIWTGNKFVNGIINNTGVLKTDGKIFLDFALVKNQQNEHYIFTMTVKGNENPACQWDLGILDESLFINEQGQTYFSTAIYEQCDATDHHDHRGIEIYHVDAYTFDATGATITLEEGPFYYDDGVSIKPEVTVKLGDYTLIKNTDYYIQYKNNKEVGTASVTIGFMGDFLGNDAVTKEFEIVEKPTPDDDSEGDKEQSNTKKGCGGSIIASSIVISSVALAGIGLLAFRKRKEK